MLDTVGNATDGYARLRSPGRIQGFGVLLGLHPRTLRIVCASENAASLFGGTAADLLGAALPDLVGEAAGAELRAACAADVPSFANPVPVEIGGRRAEAVLHVHDGLVLAEIEPLPPGAPSRADMDRLNDAAIAGMMVPGDMAALIEAAPAAIRAATGFDRVMLYRFDESCHGQVIAESRAPGVDGFMGLFFPESDIGAPARQLYAETFCRYIPRLDGPTHRMLPAENPLTGRALDMSPAALRAVAPCHIEYLVNMGIVASMSYSIMVGGKLWGLFACHHNEPARLSPVQRQVCEQIAMLFVARLEELLNPAAQREEMARRLRAACDIPALRAADPLAAEWTPAQEAALLELVEAEGAALYRHGKVGQIGRCPDFAELHAFMQQEPAAFGRLLRMYDEDGLFHTNAIASVLPFGERMRAEASGVMIVPLSRDPGTYLLWFRPELVVHATWGGNPGSPHGTDPALRFSPRKSFAAWKQDIRDRAAPWTAAQIANALALRDTALGVRH